MGIFN